MQKKHCCDVVETLNVAYLSVIIGKCKQNIEECVLSSFVVPGHIIQWVVHHLFRTFFIEIITECSPNVFLDSVLISWVVNLSQLLVESFCMHLLLSVDLAKHTPYISSEAVWNAFNE